MIISDVRYIKQIDNLRKKEPYIAHHRLKEAKILKLYMILQCSKWITFEPKNKTCELMAYDIGHGKKKDWIFFHYI
jgi:hypothetical protein